MRDLAVHRKPATAPASGTPIQGTQRLAADSAGRFDPSGFLAQAPPVFRLTDAPGTPSPSGAVQPVQAKLKVGPTDIRDLQHLREVVTFRVRKTLEVLLNRNPDRWKKILGGQWKNAGRRSEMIKQWVGNLEALIEAGEAYSVGLVDGLREMAWSPPWQWAVPERIAATPEEMEEAIAQSDAAETYTWLKDRDEVMDQDALRTVAYKAMTLGGHLFELELAKQALEYYVDTRHEEAYIQIGHLTGKRSILERLEATVAASTNAVAQDQSLGADVVVWRVKEAEDGTKSVSGVFTQAKQVKFQNIWLNARYARQQLEGQTNSGEKSLHGGSHRGYIIFDITDRVEDVARLKKTAEHLNASPFVSGVLFREGGVSYVFRKGDEEPTILGAD